MFELRFFLLTSYWFLRERHDSKCIYWTNVIMMIGSGEFNLVWLYWKIIGLHYIWFFMDLMVGRLVVRTLLWLFWGWKRGVWRYTEFLLLCKHTLFICCWLLHWPPLVNNCCKHGCYIIKIRVLIWRRKEDEAYM